MSLQYWPDFSGRRWKSILKFIFFKDELLVYSLTRAWTIFLWKTLERQQKFIYWVCNSIQLRCSSAYWIYRFERENNSLEIHGPVRSWLTFCCSPQAEKSKRIPVTFSHVVEQKYIHSHSAAGCSEVFWIRLKILGLFMNANQGRYVINEQFYPQVRGESYPYLQLCTCSCVYT